MDKNTITGLLLMAAVMFGFLWLSKPSESDIAAERERSEQLVKDNVESSAQPLAADVDSMLLAKAIRTTGTSVADGEYILTNDFFTLSLDSVKGICGEYHHDGVSAPVADIIAGKSTLDASSLSFATKELKRIVDNSLKYEGFARYLGGKTSETVLENDLVRVTLSSLGGRISQVELKEFMTETTETPSNILLFRDSSDAYGFRFNTSDQRIDTRDLNFKVIAEGDSAVTMSISPAPGAEWAIRYVLQPDSYVVRMSVVQKGMNVVLPVNTASMDFNWHQKLARNEVGRTFEERNSAIFYKYIGEGVDELNATGDDDETLSGRVRWVAFKNQFFSSVIIARDCFSSAELKSVEIKDDRYLKDMSLSATLPYTIADGVAADFDFYFGPNEYPVLSGLDDTLAIGEDLSLTRLIPLGWTLFRWINTLIVIPVFTFLGQYISNYGIIILILTIFIKLLIFPFTYKSFKSQAKMRVLAPEIKEINEKYPDQADAMKRQQETMALYSRAGASPFSGCLPMLLQMPVLIAMFCFLPSAIELRGQSFLWAHDLSAPDYIFKLPFSIPFYGDHVSLFCLLMTIVNIVYMQLSMQNQPQSAGMPGMKVMQYMMPVMFLFIFNDYASGLSYYYLLSLFITIIQTYIFRHTVDEKKVREQLLANARKPRKKSGWMARLEEAQKQALAAQRQQQQANKRRK